MESALSLKGQVTIPQEARDYLGIAPGDKVKFFIHPDGTVVILPKISLASLRGIARGRAQGPVSLEEMEAAIEEGATRRHLPELTR